MHLTSEGLITSPTDLARHHECAHITTLDLDTARGDRHAPGGRDPMLDLLAEHGQDHEAAYLETLRRRGLTITEIPRGDYTPAALHDAERATLEAMRSGVDVIYQATFFHDGRAGYADFLRRTTMPSDLGAWSYEVLDTKLAAHVKVDAILQVCEYSAHVERLQGVPPRDFVLVLGDLTESRLRLADHAAYYRAVTRQFAEALVRPLPTVPEPCSYCDRCRWAPVCEQRWRDEDDLTLVANISASQRHKLAAAGISTVDALAASSGPVPNLAAPSLQKLRAQAALQIAERRTGTAAYEFIGASQGRGFEALPEPSPGDLFYDIEGDPLWPDGGLEYLHGVSETDTPRSFHAFWAHDRAQEKVAFESLMSFFMERLRRFPAMHIYHYAQYEKTALRRLAARHAVCEAEVDILLRGNVFVDLYDVVRHSMRISKESYSLKYVEKFFMPTRQGEVTNAAGSVVEYERWLVSRDQAILDSIEQYNRVDCESTVELRAWLEQLRREAESARGEPIPRPDIIDGEPGENVRAEEAEATRLARTLLGTDDDAVYTRALLGFLLSFHRREDRSAWRDYFAHREMDLNDLVEDGDAIGAVAHAGAVGTEKRSAVHRFTFDPGQPHHVGTEVVVDPLLPATADHVGKVVDVGDGYVDVKLRRACDPDTVRSLFGWHHVKSDPIPAALRRVALWMADHNAGDPGQFRAARDLLLRTPPRLRDGALRVDGDTASAAALRCVTSLDDSVLAIQGPPGTGKSYTGARMAAHLIAEGRAVGVSAPSHRAAVNLAQGILDECARRGITVRAVQKAKPGSDEPMDHPCVRVTDKVNRVADEVRDGALLVIGTAWLFANSAMEELVDTLFIDEAGQYSLANAVGAATAARNLVLLGDPQQLAQVMKGAHPDGSDASALGHLLGEHHTMPEDLGLFLETSYRMHPDVCGVVSDLFYDGQLSAAPHCARQHVGGEAGIRFIAVEHHNCDGRSPQEVDVIRGVVDGYLGTQWSPGDGPERPLTHNDIIVITPFNAQRELLSAALPGIQVGTVDKFQGREGALAIYSMACSTVEDAPRGTEFLFEMNRFNVAISRARALAVVVASPLLLRAHCTQPGQIPKVNALCWFVERAGLADASAPRMLSAVPGTG